MDWASLGMGVAGGLVDSLDIGGNRRRKKQIEQQQKLTDMQTDANKELANHGMAISKEMFDATGYGAQRKQMEDAGLNPALMYGHAGAGGSTQSAGAGSAGMGQASDEASQKMASTQAKGMALQLAKLQSEIAINKAQAKNLNVDADKKAGVDTDLAKANIESITEDIENKKVQREGMFLQNNYDEMRNALQQGSFNDNLKLLEYQAKQAEANVKKLLEEVHGMDIDNRLKLQNFDALGERIRLENEQLLADILVKGSQGRLNDTTANALVKELGMKMLQIGVNMDKNTNEKEFNKIYKYAAELGAETQRDNNLNSNITMITSTLLGIIGLTAGGKGKAKPVKGFGR